MNDLSVLNSEQRLERFMTLVDERLREEEDAEEAKKNRNFVQLYTEGFKRIKELIDSKQPTAAKLYLFLSEHMERGLGAVVASQQLLAEELNVSVRTIINVSKYLEDTGAITRIRLGPGSVYAYCLNPDEVWKSWNNQKQYAAFNTKTLARKGDNGDVKRKLKVMLKADEPDKGSDS